MGHNTDIIIDFKKKKKSVSFIENLGLLLRLAKSIKLQKHPKLFKLKGENITFFCSSHEQSKKSSLLYQIKVNICSISS